VGRTKLEDTAQQRNHLRLEVIIINGTTIMIVVGEEVAENWIVVRSFLVTMGEIPRIEDQEPILMSMPS